MYMFMRVQFNDICFGGAPHAGHLDQTKLEKVFPIFELQFAEVRARRQPLSACVVHIRVVQALFVFHSMAALLSCAHCLS